MSIIHTQVISNGKPLSFGKVYIGLAGTIPLDNPVSVFTDYLFTQAIDTPVNLDFDGMPLDSDSNRVNLYANFSYSIQIVSEDNAGFYQDEPNITVV